MTPPLFVRDLIPEEQSQLEEALGSDCGFTLRRAQILRLSGRGLSPPRIAEVLGCSAQTVRNGIHDFHERGLQSLKPQPMGPKNPERIFNEAKSQKLMEMTRTSPRAFGKERSTWSLEALAEVAFEEGLTDKEVSHETVRQAIQALGVSWQRAKHWINSPDEQYALKKSKGTA